jgi:hypothetical protein
VKARTSQASNLAGTFGSKLGVPNKAAILRLCYDCAAHALLG